MFRPADNCQAMVAQDNPLHSAPIVDMDIEDATMRCSCVVPEFLPLISGVISETMMTASSRHFAQKRKACSC